MDYKLHGRLRRIGVAKHKYGYEMKERLRKEDHSMFYPQRTSQPAYLEGADTHQEEKGQGFSMRPKKATRYIEDVVSFEGFIHGDMLSENNFIVSKKENEGPSGFLPCQLPPKELNPGSFTLPCTIGSLNMYALTWQT
nr:hypothetical protein [Tanacetum cinerariifolium]